MFVSLHRLNEEGHQRFETLAADPVRRLPDHNQRIADCLIIKSARGPWSAPCGLFAAQHPHGVLAMKTGHCDELIQNAGFPATLAIGVSLSYRYHQFISRRHGDPPHPRLHSRISVGSKLDEATAQYPGAFLARQCDRGCRLRSEPAHRLPWSVRRCALSPGLAHHSTSTPTSAKTIDRL